MREFFNMDNSFFRALGRLADLMILNITFIICCIPVFTIGASLTGLYYMALKMAENEESYIIRGFLKSFKQNFKQATLIWLMVLGVGIVLVMDFQILRASEGSLAKFLHIAIIAISFFYLMIVTYIFPVLSRFFNTIRGTLKNSLLMSIAHLPYTVLMIVITIAPVALTFFNGYTLWYGILVWFMAGFAAIAYANSFFLKKIFKKYMPKEEEEDPDHWEVEETAEEDFTESPAEDVSSVIDQDTDTDSDSDI